MLKLSLLLTFTFGITALLGAQPIFVNGYLQDSITRLPVAGGLVTNSATKKSVRTERDGFFRLQVAPGDLLYAVAKDYRFDTVRYSILFTDTITILLPPAGDILETVTVTAGYSRYQSDSAARRKAFEELRGQRIPAVAKTHTTGFGVVVNLDRFFKQKYKHQKRQEHFFTEAEKEAYINFRFSPQLVALYTGLKGQALVTFIQQNKPGYEWLRKHPFREQLIDYLNDKLKLYKYGAGR